MRLLVVSQLRFLRQAPWSAATVVLGVALGVASVVAVHLISVQVQRSLDEATPPHLGGLTHVIEHPGLNAERYFQLREQWRREADSPVTALVPLIEGHLALEAQRLLVVGADWLAFPAQAGRGPVVARVPVEVLVGEAVLVDAETGYAEGESLRLGGRTFTVAGVRDTGLGPAVLADIAAAHALLGRPPDTVSRVGAAVTDPWAWWRHWIDRLMPGFAAGLPRPPVRPLAELMPATAALANALAKPVTAERPSAEFARSVLFNLGALGTLALLVAWFLIHQMGVIWLRRQHLLLSRLHVMGVSRAGLRRAFLSLFVILGTVATAAGVAAGVALAAALVRLSSEGAATPPAAPAVVAHVDVWVLLKALASGLGVCLLGGYGAFQREWSGRSEPSRWRWLALPALAGLVALGIGWEGSGVLGGFLAIFAMSVGTAALVTPALAALRRAVPRLRLGLLGRLALREVVWYPRVLSVALAALTLAVATAVGIGLMVESFRLDFARMLESRLDGDLYVSDVAGALPALTSWLRAQPAVTGIRPSGRARVRLQGEPVELGYARFDAAESARYGYTRPLAAGEALISERLARSLDVQPGDTVAAAQGSVAVVGTFPGFGDALGRVLVDAGTVPRFGLTPRFDRLTVDLEAGSAVAAEMARRFPDVQVESRSEIRSRALEIFDRTFAITRALTLLALAVAVVGIYNAQSALKLQQAGTRRLLHAQGLSAGEARGLALLHAAAVGGVAVALALPLGLAMAWTLCQVINPRSFGWTVGLHLTWQAWLVPPLSGLAAALAAGALPAPREREAGHEAA